MAKNYQKITQLLDEIDRANQLRKEQIKLEIEKKKNESQEKMAKYEDDLLDINLEHRRRIKLIDRLHDEYLYAGLEESNQILKRMHKLFSK